MSTDVVDRTSVNGGSSAAIEVRANASQRRHNHMRRGGKGAIESTSMQPRGALQDTNKHNRGASAPQNTDKFGNRLYSRPRRPKLLANSLRETTEVLPTVAEEAPTELSQALPQTKQAYKARRERQKNGSEGLGTQRTSEKVLASQKVGAPSPSANDVSFAQPPIPSHPHKQNGNPNGDNRSSRQSTSDRWPSRNMIRKREGSSYVPPHLRHVMDRNATPPTSPEAQRAAAPGREVYVTPPSPPPESGTREMQASGGVSLSSSKWAFPQPNKMLWGTQTPAESTEIGKQTDKAQHQPSPIVPSPPPLAMRQANAAEITPSSVNEDAELIPPTTIVVAGPSSTRVEHDTPSTEKKTYSKKLAKPKTDRNERWPKASDLRRKAKAKPDSNAWGSDTEHGALTDTWDDPEEGIRNLVDWEGNWLPAPVEWDGRRGFRERNFHERVELWIVESAEKSQYPIVLEPAFTFTGSSELAPRVWVPDVINEEAPQDWWAKHIRSPDSDCRPDDKPWWATYISVTSNLLTPLLVPDAKIDPSDENARAAAKDLGSDAAASNHQRKNNKGDKKKKAKKLEGDSKVQGSTYIPPPPNPHTPKVNVFLRPAYPSDIVQLRDIYNWHIQNTVSVPENEARTSRQIQDRIADIADNKLPYIVAVERVSRKMRANRNFPVPAEKVVGCAYADDYHDFRGMYRYTAELEVYVHPDYFMKGVGNCLLDRMLFLLDPVYSAREGYEWVGEGPFSYKGGQRVIGAVTCHVPYDAASPNRIGFITRWLQQFGFTKIGEMPRVGIKHKKFVNLAIFHYETGSSLDPETAL